MAEEGLKIKIGADVVEVVQSLNQLQTEFNDLNKQIKNAVPGSTQFNNLSAQLDVIKTKIKAVNDASAGAGSTGLKNLTNETGRANIALVNFSRVASDAPFGLIGIANNIDPLVQSFVTLRKETGSGKAALAALGASLTGGGGLILGISLVTSALQFAQLGLSRWGASSKQAKEETESLSDTIKSVSNSISREVVEVTKLVQLINSENTSRKLKNEAIKELIKTAPEYFDNLKKENININDLNEAYKKYINTIQLRIRASVIEKQLGDIISAEQEINVLRSQRGTDPFGLKSLLDVNSLNKLNTLELKTQSQENAKLLNLGGKRNILLNDLIKLQQEIGTLDVKNSNKQNNKNKKNKKDIFDLADALKQYNEQLKSINWDEQNRGIDGTKARLELAGETLRSLYLAGIKESSSAWKEVSNNFDKFGKDFDKYLAAQKLAELNKFIENYKLAFKELDIKQSITGQDQLNSRINLTIDALIELKKAGQENTAQYQDLQKTLNELKAEVGLREIRKRQQEIADIWQKYTLSADKLDFNKTRGSLDLLKSKIDLIGNTIQDLKSKGWTDQDLGIQILGAQLNGLLDQFNKLQQQKEVFDALRSSIEGGLTNAFSSVFDALLEGEDVFKALGDSIKRLVADLIKTVIQMIIVRKIASALVPGVGGKIGEEVFAVVRGDMLRNITFAR